MNIALMAHDKKKELMVQFCIAYCGILAKHNICATSTTGKLVGEATGLEITRFLSGQQGGGQQVAARIAYNEIDLVLFFRETVVDSTGESDIVQILSLCDTNNVPIATNIATAEILVQGLARGDFDWRKNIDKKTSRPLG